MNPELKPSPPKILKLGINEKATKKYVDLTYHEKEELTEYLQSIINKYLDAQCFKAAYENGVVDSSFRKLLAESILNHELHGLINKRLEPARLRRLALAIQCKFPREEADIYYIPQLRIGEEKTTPNGILYQKYQYKLSLYRKSGLINSKKKSKDQIEDHNLFQSHVHPVEATQEVLEAVTWLHTARDSSESLLQKWRETSNYRLSILLNRDQEETLDEYLHKFPALDTTLGKHLIEIDFDTLNPGASNKFFEQWPLLVPRIISLAQRKCKKDSSFKKILDSYCPDYAELQNFGREIQDFFALWLLVCLFPHVKGSKKNPGFTKEEVKEDFFLHVSDLDSREAEVEKRVERAQKEGLAAEPLPIIVGTDCEKLLCFVRVFTTEYPVSSPIEAIDLCFKSFFVLGLKYPVRSRRVWAFIHKYIYKLELAKKYHHSTLAQMATDLGLSV